MSETEAAQIIDLLKSGKSLVFEKGQAEKITLEYGEDNNVFHIHSEDRRTNYIMPEQNEQYFTEQSFRRWLMASYLFEEVMKRV